MNRQQIVRVLSWYERDPGDQFVGEEVLRDISLTELQTLFHRPSDDPMYDSYPVTSSHVERLQSAVSIQIEPHRWAYFVESFSKRET